MKRFCLSAVGAIALAGTAGLDAARAYPLRPFPWLVAQSFQGIGLPSPFRDGMLVRGANGSVYLIAAGKRHLVPNEAAFRAWGFRWENAIKLPDDALQSIPEAAPLGDRLPAYPEGTLLKGEGPTVFVMRAGLRRAIPDIATFTAMGWKWENVRAIPAAELEAIAEASPLASPADFSFKDGTLLKGSSPAVYVMSGGRRRLIPNIATFNALGYRWDNVLPIADWHLAAIPELPPLPAYPSSESGDRTNAN